MISNNSLEGFSHNDKTVYFGRQKFSHEPTQLTILDEPYTGPGDYNVPKLIGNKDIVYSHIKTPP